MGDSQNKQGKKKKNNKAKTTLESDFVDLEKDNSINVDEEVPSVEVEDKNDSDDIKPTAKRARKERSVVWNYFTKYSKKAVGDKVPTKCNKCDHIMIYDSKQGTGNHSKHITSCSWF